MIILSLGLILLYLLIIVIISIIVFIIILINKSKKFINEHSISIRKIKELNERYIFKEIKSFEFEESFDNEIYYNKLNTEDLLVYDLIKNKEEVKNNISSTIYNMNQYDLYLFDIKNIKNLGQYDTDDKPKFNYLLLKLEQSIFNNLIQKPTIDYKLKVTIVLTNINQDIIEKRYYYFDIEEIEEVISRLENKTNERYNDKEIWDSICRIERAKVTNRMRFAIYNRDGYRCCRCGRKTNDLEIDHIMPISKGGKTHPDNLQTLCKRCNMEKSNIIESGTKVYKGQTNKVCPLCGAPLGLLIGRMVSFMDV